MKRVGFDGFREPDEIVIQLGVRAVGGVKDTRPRFRVDFFAFRQNILVEAGDKKFVKQAEILGFLNNLADDIGARFFRRLYLNVDNGKPAAKVEEFLNRRYFRPRELLGKIGAEIKTAKFFER